MESSTQPERLWRIVKFNELVDILRAKQMRVARADQFSDLNEFLANALGIEHLRWLLPTGASDIDVPEWRDSLRTSCFTTCWSRVQAHAKIWEEYSKNHQGVQIECNLDALRRSFHRFYPLMDNILRHNTPANEGVLFWSPIDHGDCVYVDLDGYEAECENMAASYEQGGRSLIGDKDGFREHYERYTLRAEELNRRSLRVKDESYSFENEYRFSWIARTRNSMEYDEASARPLFPLTDDHLRNARPDETQPHVYFPFDINIINCVYLDRRAPATQIEDWIEILHAAAPKLDVKVANF